MPDERDESEATRMRADVARAWRNLAIIFGVGIVAVVATIVFVLRHRPEGHMDDGPIRPAPFPHVVRPASSTPSAGASGRRAAP